jgi:hypothetical protein
MKDQSTDGAVVAARREGLQLIDLRTAAQIRGISKRALQRWITIGHFTARDGLRRFGGMARIQLATMLRRIESGELRRRRGRDGADLDHHPQEVGHRPPLHASMRAEAQDSDAGDREVPTARRDALERAGVGAREPETPG